MELRKWAANNPALLEEIPAEHLSSYARTLGDAHQKVLGLTWEPNTDSFKFVVRINDMPCTKRFILSEIAKIYDPLGFLAPVILYAKILIQQLWSTGTDWDEPPPQKIVSQWNILHQELPLLSQLQLPRCILPFKVDNCQLHGFCDASSHGYAAVVYLRFRDTFGAVHLKFVAAKSRVAPLKVVSIPRLELNAAVLLTDLLHSLSSVLSQEINFETIHAWSDSKVTLAWIHSSPHRWKPFVANRVAAIQENLAPSAWKYVPTDLNPADIASRGTCPRNLLETPTWFDGPEFLRLDPESWPTQTQRESTSPLAVVDSEQRKVTLLAQRMSDPISEMLSRVSSFSKAQRVVARILRMVKRVRQLAVPENLSMDELQEATDVIVRAVQRSEFRSEIDSISGGRGCPKRLLQLAPFLDENSILRVGGRLKHSQVPSHQKYPILLPKNHRLSELILWHYHVTNLHGASQLTISATRTRYWILGVRVMVKRTIRNCVTCTRARPQPFQPPMADLPAPRVTPAKPFQRVGIDYAGPLSITMSRRRGARSQKAYICILVCFVTKALHLELVSDLTSAACLAAIRRFIGRRGQCSEVYSDNGTNFIGASRILNRIFHDNFTNQGIKWHFNPPSSPHFGGLWERAVRSVKFHLTRTIGHQVLTYEELSTVLVQIEATLNSRPLTALSDDPNDLEALTPMHLLGIPPTTAPENIFVDEEPANLRSRWNLVQQIQAHFWKRWRQDYLQQLQRRSKWVNNGRFNPPLVGDLVIVSDANFRTHQWGYGRILQLHPGPDDTARVATIRTASGSLKRPLVKLCRLTSGDSQGTAPEVPSAGEDVAVSAAPPV